MTLFAGTSGFSYPEWRGEFYPPGLPASRMLQHYSSLLNGVELNGSFYRTPQASALSKWASETPPAFRFCFKAHRGLTYSGAGFDKEGLARDFARRLDGLDGRQGPLLLQFPPTLAKDTALLDRLLAVLGGEVAVEFRNESWFAEPVYAVLRSHGAALAVTDQEKWPRAPRVQTGPFGYYRLRRDYEVSELADWRRELRAEAAARETLHVYFRHVKEGPARARFMLE